MIAFRDVAKSYRVRGKTHHVIRPFDFTLPEGRNIAVIGRNGAGKTTLLRMISGTVRPTQGRIERNNLRISWPLAFSGGFHPVLTGRQNARFIARTTGADVDAMDRFVAEFSELGRYFDMAVDTYSSGMRARLAFATSMALRFDLYLVDEITAVGDTAFQEKCRAMFRERLASSRMIMVSHSDKTLREYCDAALYIEDGNVWFYDDLDKGLATYRQHLMG